MSGVLTAAQLGATISFTATLDESTPDQSVTFGDFVFDAWEIPEKITWGGQQKLVVHKLIGGDRVIDAMGPDNADVTWSGIFLSQDASLRADQLDQMRKEGRLDSLIFAGRYYTAAIADFRADQRMLSYVPYQITFCVQRDQSAVELQYDPTALSAANADTLAAMSFLTTPPDQMAGVAASFGLIPPLLLPLQTLSAGAAGTAVAVGAMVGTAALIGAVDTSASATVAGIAAASVLTGTLIGATTVVDAVPAMANALVATQTIALTAVTGAYLGRAIATAQGA